MSVSASVTVVECSVLHLPVPFSTHREAGSHSEGIIGGSENVLHQPDQTSAVERPDDIQTRTG